MLEQFSKSPSLLSVTDYEEHIWLLQLQQPEQVTDVLIYGNLIKV